MKKLGLLCSTLIALLFSLQGFATTSFPLFFTMITGGVLTIIPSIPDHLYPHAGIKINTPGYSLTNEGTECTPEGNGYCLFAVSSNAPKSISISGPAGLVSVTLCLNGKAPISCQTDTISTSLLAFAYITNANSTVTQCAIDALTGSLGPCTDSGATNLSGVGKGIALLPDKTAAYVVNGPLSRQVTKCLIDANTGAFTGCIDSGAILPDRASGIVIDPESRFAYILYMDAAINQSKILKCAIDPVTGLLTPCTDSGATGLTGLTSGPALNFEGTFIYVSNSNLTISVCSVDRMTGNVGPCNAALNSPPAILRKIALNPTGTYAYILLAVSNTVRQCTVDSVTGALSACMDSGAPATGSASSIVINTQGTFAYIMNSSTIITQCNINPATGNLTACVNSGATGINNSLGEMAGF